MNLKIYLVYEHFWNGMEYEESRSGNVLKQAFDTPAKAKAWIRHEKKVTKLDARRCGNKVCITADKYGIHVTVTDEYGEGYVDWTIKEIIVR